MKLSVKDNSWIELILVINVASVSISDEMKHLGDKVKSKGLTEIQECFDKLSDDTFKIIEEVEQKYIQLYGMEMFESIVKRVYNRLAEK